MKEGTQPNLNDTILGSMLSEFCKVKVYLPNGQTFTKLGHWFGLVSTRDPHTQKVVSCGVVVATRYGPNLDFDKDVEILDPRGVYIGDDGRIKFSPRDNMGSLAPWVIKWLDRHPYWPAILEL